MKGLVDGDILVFRCGFAAERNLWHLTWGDGESKTFEYKREALEHLDKVLPGKFSREEGKDYALWPERELEPLSHALHGVKRTMTKLAEACALDLDREMVVMLSPGGETFRHREASYRPYKGNRKAEHRPTYEKEIRKYIIENYPTYIAEDEEADDLLAIWQTKLGPDQSIIITMDKDLDQVPGLKYNWMHDVAYEITPEEGDYNFCMQMLTGDTTDNIVGLPKVGKAKATKILSGLKGYDDMMKEVAYQYHVRSPVPEWEEYLTEMGRLLWIRRQPGEMWLPPASTVEDEWDMTEEELTL